MLKHGLEQGLQCQSLALDENYFQSLFSHRLCPSLCANEVDVDGLFIAALSKQEHFLSPNFARKNFGWCE